MSIDKILVIDDCRINVLLLKHVIGRINVRVDSAGSGEEGLALASRADYPLIFVDILMPGIDGLETCRRIREQSHAMRPRLILLTSMGEQFSQEMATEVGADSVIFKPIVPSQIVEVVKEALRASETRDQPEAVKP